MLDQQIIVDIYSAKKSVDDRSLNLGVYQKLTEALAAGNLRVPLNILEIGCGIGTMIERLWDWGSGPSGDLHCP